MSFLDRRIDRAEAFVLRELGMSSLLMLPLAAAGRPWGLVEVYDVRLRCFDDVDLEAGRQLVAACEARLADLVRSCANLFEPVAAHPLQRPHRSARRGRPAGADPARRRAVREG